jgi:hypothetical protein
MAIQPSMAIEDLTLGMMQTEDPVVISYLTNLLRVWSFERTDLPPDFVDEVQVTSLLRQPATLLNIELEIKRVTLISQERPFQGQAVNGSRWYSSDPFEVLKIKVADFPSSGKEETFQVPGEESVKACENCRSAGEIACSECVSGQIDCPECSGVARRTCDRCEGGGYHLGARGDMIQCQLCNTRGTVRCTRCNRGRVTCGNCSGRSMITCSRCKGHGNLHIYWLQKIETTTVRDTLSLMEQMWPLQVQQLEDDSTVFEQVWWTWPIKNPPEFKRDLKIPPAIQDSIFSKISSQLGRTAQALGSDSRITALRVAVSGVYLYAIDYEFVGKNTRVFVGGKSNRIFSENHSNKGSKFLQGIKRLGYSFANTVSNYTPPVDRKFLTAVRRGTVHIADTRCLGSALREDTSLNIEISESGYSASLKSLGPQSLEIAFEFDASGRVILVLERQLGPADRARFAQALELNRRLSFGRLALTKRDGREKFLLTDRRIYKTAQPKQLTKIIRCMLVESKKLTDAGF